MASSAAPVVVKFFTHYGNGSEFAFLNDTDTAMHGRGTQIDQEPVGLEYAVSLEEGMDHARLGHSSECPGKDDGVERRVGVFETLGLADAESNTVCKAFRQLFARRSDELWSGSLA
jgi:hypothetical protein